MCSMLMMPNAIAAATPCTARSERPSPCSGRADQRGQRGLTEPAEAERGERDAELRRGQVSVEALGDLEARARPCGHRRAPAPRAPSAARVPARTPRPRTGRSQATHASAVRSANSEGPPRSACGRRGFRLQLVRRDAAVGYRPDETRPPARSRHRVRPRPRPNARAPRPALDRGEWLRRRARSASRAPC